MINAETKKVADELTAPGGALEDVKNEMDKALDEIKNQFNGFDDKINEIYKDISEVSLDQKLYFRFGRAALRP